ncbi:MULTISPECIES: phosphopantetheine-binding protein [Bacillaceae]|uniref:phosphopantetheine-binding protein n=1 Tax=Bacillaceae TaxID=186817 RepID=UPI001D003B0F
MDDFELLGLDSLARLGLLCEIEEILGVNLSSEGFENIRRISDIREIIDILGYERVKKL